MIYEIELSKESYKYLLKIDKPTRIRILDGLNILVQNPRNSELDIKKFQGKTNLYRLRIGIYRVLYSIHGDILVINVIKIGPRGDVYK
ncbi:type II toxin-antitoxin system RelE family toxin [Serpentinicella alkaliphila]|uniref:mRNA interferase RelE/StbE n=1 Tax=Serpentinicella alkaliphila TaxID=1734049 RepID=A0A4R2TI61_9FIRM|nr:type II toxin-antitoxin system RelE/ParE family toxin [Serpentinicella alkaliphila]TCQ02911.1 mRNA interferase RelE/StbE [Serpentinicella alkaliphila]